MRQVTRDVHEVEVRVAHELNLGRFKQAVVVLADKAGILDGFLCQVPDVCLGADDTDVCRVAVMALVGQGNVLAEKHTDSDTGHVKAVKE